MLMAVQEPYALMVQQDDILINPREPDEPLGTMVCFHRRYALGDRHDFADKDTFLQKLYLDTVGNTPEGEASYKKLVDSFSNERAVDNALLDVISEKYIVQPLYLLDHSGLAMQTTSFHDPWDSGQVGWIYVSKEAVQKAFEISELTEDDLQKARTMLDSEVAIYDSYLRGECYGYELYKNGELEDSCWGFLGPVEEAVQAMTDHLPDECRDMVKRLEEQNHPATIIKTLLRHAKIQVEQAAKTLSHESRQLMPDR